MRADDTARAVAEARRNVHESLTGLPAWAADDTRAKVAALEVVIEQHIRAQVAEEQREPVIARWKDGVVHHDAGTTVELVDADDPLRGIALELDPEHREALDLMLIDPDGEMDQPDGVFSELRTVSVEAPADAKLLPNGFGEFSITPKWVDIEYRWCDPNLPDMGAFQAGRSHVEVHGPIVGSDFDSEEATVTFRTRTDDKRPDWVKRLVAKHNPPSWPLTDSRADDTTSQGA